MIVETAPLLPDQADLAALLHAEAMAAGPGDPAWDASAFRHLLTLPTVRGLCAAEAGEPAGLVLLQQAAGEAEILTIAVRPDFRRRGIARALLADVILAAATNGALRLLLEVASDNAPAFALYRGAGFEPVGRRPRYYRRPAGQPADALIMARPLSPP